MSSERELLEQIDALLASDFMIFLSRVFYTLHPGRSLDPEWHLEAMAHVLMRVADGQTRRQIITIPPRHLKSITTSVAFCAWMLGRDPGIRISVVSYGADLASMHTRSFRTIMNAAWFKQAFPAVGCPTKDTETEFVTRAGGFRRSMSIGGGVTGFGGDIVIIDDLMKASDATSAAARDEVRHFYESTLVSRLDSKREGRLIVIQQRLHEEDLVGILLEKGGFDHLNLPAFAERDDSVPLTRGRLKQRRIGEVLSRREDREVLNQLRTEMGSAAFATQYQQNPTAEDGNIIRWHKFQFYDEAPERIACDLIVQSWDTAIAVSSRNSFSVGTTWGRLRGIWFLLDLQRVRLEFPDLLAFVRLLRDKWMADIIIVEQAASGHQLIQMLHAEQMQRHSFRRRRGESPGWRVHPFAPAPDKVTRFAAQSTKLENGFALLPRNAIWLDNLRREMLRFPNGAFDDQVDSISQFLAYTDHLRPPRPERLVKVGQM